MPSCWARQSRSCAPLGRQGWKMLSQKRRDSSYRASIRSNNWLNLKLEQSQEFVIGGYNPDSGSFQSILVGYYEREKLMFTSLRFRAQSLRDELQ